jgi:Toprim domain
MTDRLDSEIGGTHSALASQRAPAQLVTTPIDHAGRQNALRLWDEAVPIAGTLAERYLIEARKLVLPPDISPRVLRFHPRVYFDANVSFGPAWHPCLLALYRKIELPIFLTGAAPVESEPCAVMRTALTPDARKIGHAALGPVSDAAIKLSDDADVTAGLTIGERLETVLSRMVFGFAPAWALGSAGGIRTFPVLSGIEALTILTETDGDGTRQRAIQQCLARWSTAGREVYRVTSMIGSDANDALTKDVA